MKSTAILFALALVCITSVVNAQTTYASSSDGVLFAQSSFKGKRSDLGSSIKNAKNLNFSYIRIYKYANNDYVQILQFATLQKNQIEKIGFSPDNQYLFARCGNEIAVWNIRSGDLIVQLNDVVAFDFRSFNDFFIALINDELGKYSLTTGERDRKYNIAKGIKEIEAMSVSENDQYFTLRAGGYIYLWHTNKPQMIDKFKAEDIKFNDKKKHIVLLEASKGSISLLLGKNPKLVKRKIEIGDLINKKLKVAYKKRYNSADYKPRKENREAIFLSDDGSYWTAHITSGKTNDVQDEVVVFDTFTDSLLLWVEKTKLQTNQPWQESSRIALSSDEHNELVLDILSADTCSIVNYEYDFATVEKSKEDKRVQKTVEQIKLKRKINPVRSVVVFDGGTKWAPSVYAKSTKELKEKEKKNKTVEIKNARFGTYSPDGEIMVVEGKNGKAGTIDVWDIENAQNEYLGFKKVRDTLWTPEPEKEVKKDFVPAGYRYIKIRKIMPIDSLPTNRNVELFLRTLQINDTLTQIQVHLMDTTGIYYYGASHNDWRHIWKNLIVKTEYGMRAIDNYGITEFMGETETPTAIALILDHSGSMGEERALRLQRAAENFIDKKRPQDGMVIIKYDHRMLAETPFTTDNVMLKNKMKITGLKGFGGSTSLLDAVNRGVGALKNVEGFGKKTVIVFTDGKENSSFTSVGATIKNANLSEIPVSAIGFGNEVDPQYLDALASNTGGSYYQIYRTEDFDWILDDVYKKLHYYYTIGFTMDSLERLTARLDLGINKTQKDSIVLSFSNLPPDYKQMNHKFESPFTDLLAHGGSFDANDFNVFKDSISNDAVIVREEFAKIDFPDLQFVINSTVLVKGTENGVMGIVDFMKKYPKYKLKIQGHTDNTGSEEMNIKLSTNRANVIKKLMMERGIDSTRIETKGFGESKPVADNATEQGRALNRRVEFILDLASFDLPDFVGVASQYDEKTLVDNILVSAAKTTGKFTIEIKGNLGIDFKKLSGFVLTNAAGKEIINKKTFKSNIEEFDISKEEKGVYKIAITFGLQTLTYQIEKE